MIRERRVSCSEDRFERVAAVEIVGEGCARDCRVASSMRCLAMRTR